MKTKPESVCAALIYKFYAMVFLICSQKYYGVSVDSAAIDVL